MATQIIIKVGDRSTTTRVVENLDDCLELDNFNWVDHESIQRSIILYGDYYQKVGDVVLHAKAV